MATGGLEHRLACEVKVLGGKRESVHSRGEGSLWYLQVKNLVPRSVVCGGERP